MKKYASYLDKLKDDLEKALKREKKSKAQKDEERKAFEEFKRGRERQMFG